MSDNYLIRAQDERSLAELLQEVEDLKKTVANLSPGEQVGTYLTYTPRLFEPFSVTNTFIGVFPLPKKFGGLLGFGGSGVVVTTNNSTNYWEVELYNVLTTQRVAWFHTGFSTADVWTKYFSKAIVNAPAVTIPAFLVKVIKIGTPGTLYMAPYCAIL